MCLCVCVWVCEQLDFWFKALDSTKMPQTNVDYQSDPESMRRFVFFSKVSPPRAILSLEIRADTPENTLAQWFGTCGEFENMDNSRKGMYRVGEWFRVAIIYGLKNAAGQRSVNVMAGSSPSLAGTWLLQTTSVFAFGIRLVPK